MHRLNPFSLTFHRFPSRYLLSIPYHIHHLYYDITKKTNKKLHIEPKSNSIKTHKLNTNPSSSHKSHMHFFYTTRAWTEHRQTHTHNQSIYANTTFVLCTDHNPNTDIDFRAIPWNGRPNHDNTAVLKLWIIWNKYTHNMNASLCQSYNIWLIWFVFIAQLFGDIPKIGVLLQ